MRLTRVSSVVSIRDAQAGIAGSVAARNGPALNASASRSSFRRRRSSGPGAAAVGSRRNSTVNQATPRAPWPSVRCSLHATPHATLRAQSFCRNSDITACSSATSSSNPSLISSPIHINAALIVSEKPRPSNVFTLSRRRRSHSLVCRIIMSTQLSSSVISSSDTRTK